MGGMKAILHILLILAAATVLSGTAMVVGETLSDRFHASAPVSDKPATIGVKSSTEYVAKDGNYSGILATVVHDGHWFVVETRYSKGAILHHPSCPCANP
jgi:ascorbate-specific PTS system EIIC-type component UlaA